LAPINDAGNATVSAIAVFPNKNIYCAVFAGDTSSDITCPYTTNNTVWSFREIKGAIAISMGVSDDSSLLGVAYISGLLEPTISYFNTVAQPFTLPLYGVYNPGTVTVRLMKSVMVSNPNMVRKSIHLLLLSSGSPVLSFSPPAPPSPSSSFYFKKILGHYTVIRGMIII